MVRERETGQGARLLRGEEDKDFEEVSGLRKR